MRFPARFPRFRATRPGKENEMKREYYWLLGGVIGGIIFAGPIRRIPVVGTVVSKIPTV